MPHAGAFNFAFAHFTTKFTHFKLNKISVVSTSSVLEDFSDFCLSPLSINRDYNKTNLIFLRIITRRKRLICHGELCSATNFLAEKLRATITESCSMALVHFSNQIILNIPKFIVLCFCVKLSLPHVTMSLSLFPKYIWRGNGGEGLVALSISFPILFSVRCFRDVVNCHQAFFCQRSAKVGGRAPLKKERLIAG